MHLSRRRFSWSKTLPRGSSLRISLYFSLEFHVSWKHEKAIEFCFNAFSSREPASISIENALMNRPAPSRDGAGGHRPRWRLIEQAVEGDGHKPKSCTIARSARIFRDKASRVRAWRTSRAACPPRFTPGHPEQARPAAKRKKRVAVAMLPPARSYDFRTISSEIVFHSRGNPPFAWRISARFRFRGSRSDLAETVS